MLMSRRMAAIIARILRRYGLHVFQTLPRGMDVGYDFRRALPHQNFLVIFDVGANLGQSTAAFLKEFPKAAIWAFEPNRDLYCELRAQFAWTPRVTAQQLAFSSEATEATLVHTSVPTMSHIAQASSKLPTGVTEIGSETVHLTTIDLYCEEHGIHQVDFLKIDTEGHDLDVLIGSRAMLEAGRIMCIQCECGLHPDNGFHRPLEELKAFLEGFGYRLFGFYEQIEEWFGDTPNLRRANIVFLAPQVLRENPSRRLK